MTKTNAVRLLEAHGVPHQTIPYAHDGDLDASAVADAIGVERDSVFKTLVARGDREGVAVFCIPGPAELDLKKAAIASGNRKVELVALRELHPLTGYVRGGCSPVGMRKPYPAYLDETAQLFDRIHVSAGARGLQLRIAPADLLRAAGMTYADLI